MSYEELPHTADVRIRVRAGSTDELFAEAARAISSIMYAPCSGAEETETLEIEAEDLETLMHDFLSEILYLSEVKEVVFCSFRVEVRDHSLRAVMAGERFERRKHGGGTEIKGVSYSGLKIYKEGGDHVLEVIFDV